MNQQKKILIVVSSLNRGGTENHICQVFPKLHGEEFHIVIYTTHQRGVLSVELEQKGITIYSSRLAEFFHHFGKIGRLFAYAISAFRLFCLNIKYRPNIVHCYLPGPYLLGGFCARLTQRPHLLMSRRGMNYYHKKYPKLAQQELKLHEKTSKILANSKRVFNQLLDEEFLEEEKLCLIYNGIDLSKYNKEFNIVELKSQLNINLNSLVMVIVANLFPYKAHSDLLQALSLIQKKLPNDWVLLCIGRDEGCLSFLKNDAEKQGISQNIRWLGERSDVSALLSISDIGILCSHEEGFSNSVVEGMAMSLPMVVTDVGGNAEAVIHQEHGLVVPPKDPSALADALLLLANDPSLRKQLGNAAKKRAEMEFSLDRCVESYRQVYRELT